MLQGVEIVLEQLLAIMAKVQTRAALGVRHAFTHYAFPEDEVVAASIHPIFFAEIEALRLCRPPSPIMERLGIPGREPVLGCRAVVPLIGGVETLLHCHVIATG